MGPFGSLPEGGRAGNTCCRGWPTRFRFHTRLQCRLQDFVRCVVFLGFCVGRVCDPATVLGLKCRRGREEEGRIFTCFESDHLADIPQRGGGPRVCGYARTRPPRVFVHIFSPATHMCIYIYTYSLHLILLGSEILQNISHSIIIIIIII